MRSYIAAAFLAVAAMPAFAQAPAASGDWRVNLGALGFATPSYEGSNSYKARALPLIDIEWRETVFLSGERGLGANLVTLRDPSGRGAFRAGPFVNYRFSRDQGDDDDLRGMGDVKDGVDAGAFASYDFGPLGLRVSGRHSVSRSELGGTIDLGLRYRLAPIGGTTFGFGPSVTWADSDYMQTYFGVTGAQAAASGMRAYSPSSGFKDVGLSANALYPLGGKWALTGLGSYKRLIGDAADSPLVKDRGTPNQFRVGLGISYRLF